MRPNISGIEEVWIVALNNLIAAVNLNIRDSRLLKECWETISNPVIPSVCSPPFKEGSIKPNKLCRGLWSPEVIFMVVVECNDRPAGLGSSLQPSDRFTGIANPLQHSSCCNDIEASLKV